MRILILIITTVVLIGVMGGLLPTIAISGVVPNLVLLFVFCLAIERTNDFLLVAFLGGLLADMGSGAGLGTFTIGYMGAGLLLHYIINQFFYLQSGWKYLPVAAAVGTVVVTVWAWVFSWVLVRFHVMPVSLFHTPFPRTLIVAILYGLLALYPVYNGTHFLLKWLSRLEQKQRFG